MKPRGGRLFFAAQHRGELNAVVRGLHLLADDGYGEATGCTLGQRLEQSRCRHTVANNDQSHR
ncbi:hypothetical protein D3C78_1466370 [compost metagenome]